MRRYGILIVIAVVVALATLRSLPGSQVQAAPLGDGASATSTITPTVTGTPTGTATATSTSTQTSTITTTPTKTATVVHLFPFIAKEPTLTPTTTSTPTPTWTPSITPTQFNCSGRFDGSITLKDNKPTYATFIEWVKFLQWVHNNNNTLTCFGILGFDAIRPDGSHYVFNSQWSASGVPDKYLRINANCWGPDGQPCAGSQGSGQQEDHMGSGNYVVAQEGLYSVNYYVCYSNYNDCLKPGANWALLGGIQFTAINWTPSPPGVAVPTEVTQTAPTGPACFLVTDDPRGIYLNCNAPQLKERQLFRH